MVLQSPSFRSFVAIPNCTWRNWDWSYASVCGAGDVRGANFCGELCNGIQMYSAFVFFPSGCGTRPPISGHRFLQLCFLTAPFLDRRLPVQEIRCKPTLAEGLRALRPGGWVGCVVVGHPPSPIFLVAMLRILVESLLCKKNDTVIWNWCFSKLYIQFRKSSKDVIFEKDTVTWSWCKKCTSDFENHVVDFSWSHRSWVLEYS